MNSVGSALVGTSGQLLTNCSTRQSVVLMSTGVNHAVIKALATLDQLFPRTTMMQRRRCVELPSDTFGGHAVHRYFALDLSESHDQFFLGLNEIRPTWIEGVHNCNVHRSVFKTIKEKCQVFPAGLRTMTYSVQSVVRGFCSLARKRRQSPRSDSTSDRFDGKLLFHHGS